MNGGKRKEIIVKRRNITDFFLKSERNFSPNDFFIFYLLFYNIQMDCLIVSLLLTTGIIRFVHSPFLILHLVQVLLLLQTRFPVQFELSEVVLPVYNQSLFLYLQEEQSLLH